MPIFLQAARTLFGSLVLFLLDRAVKWSAEFFLTQQKTIECFHWFKLRLIRNRGTVFGLFSDWKWTIPLLLLATIPVVLWILHLLFKQKASVLDQVINVFAFSGAIGNLYDRCFLGYVVDMMEVQFSQYHFPVFNLADVFLTISVLLALGAPVASLILTPLMVK